MDCSDEIHDGLIESGEICCPFCNEKLQDSIVKYETCCDCQDIIDDDGMLVCWSCGIVQGYESSVEYVTFYENRHKLKRKSIYHREYHVNNSILDIEKKYDIKIS